jgi:thiol-disulfide isomerase/thioredoxin
VQFTDLVDVSLPRLVALAVALAAAVAFGLWWSARQGRVRQVADGGASGPLDPVDLSELVASLGERGTLLQFSSAACAPCRTARRLLAEVADAHAGLSHVEVDAERHLALVRRLSVMRTPTVFVLDGDGRPVHRISGVPDRAALTAAVATLSPARSAS